MKTLHLYLTRQVVATLLMTVMVFTFVMLLVNVLREVLTLLINRQASLAVVGEAIGLLVPFVLAFALPMGMMTATLLVFGRFSADQELTAARASGVSLVSLSTPILLLSLFLCGVSAVVNLQVAPQCRIAYRDLLFRFKTTLASVYLPEGRFVKDIPNYIVYVRKNDGHDLKNVMLYQLENETNVVAKIRATRGYYEVDTPSRSLTLHLFESRNDVLRGGQWTTTYAGEITRIFDLSPTRQTTRRAAIDSMTFVQLQQELKDLESRIGMLDLATNLTRDQVLRNMRDTRKQRRDLAGPILVQMHRQVASSFACFGFTLVGIPLGIRMHRRETNVGYFLGLGLVLVYYAFIILGQSLDTRPEWAPHLIMWLPNFIFQAVGAVLLWRANRGI